MKYLRIVGIFFIFAITLAFVSALPTGPSAPITPISSSRYSTSSAQTANAIAGNVTEINLNANAITQTWQGYFGNITGNILLGDASNNTFYNWALASPQGEIYATRTATVPVWANVRCSDETEISNEDTFIGADSGADADSINRTFTSQVHDAFFVGSVSIGQDTCYSTNLYNASGAQSVYFEEVLLSDDATHEVIYTGLIDDNALGFDNRTHDFQIMVGEDGHSGDVATTTYYFYLELE
ncbi:MAG: hypothetical protein ACP5NV_03760 [Candidatus Woesearchaeota archaeon]